MVNDKKLMKDIQQIVADVCGDSHKLIGFDELIRENYMVDSLDFTEIISEIEWKYNILMSDEVTDKLYAECTIRNLAKAVLYYSKE